MAGAAPGWYQHAAPHWAAADAVDAGDQPQTASAAVVSSRVGGRSTASPQSQRGYHPNSSDMRKGPVDPSMKS